MLDKATPERRAELLGRLAGCREEEESVEYLQNTVENEGGLAFAAEVMRSYVARAVEMLSEYEPSEYRTALVNLCAYIAEGQITAKLINLNSDKIVWNRKKITRCPSS